MILSLVVLAALNLLICVVESGRTNMCATAAAPIKPDRASMVESYLQNPR